LMLRKKKGKEGGDPLVRSLISQIKRQKNKNAALRRKGGRRRFPGILNTTQDLPEASDQLTTQETIPPAMTEDSVDMLKKDANPVLPETTQVPMADKDEVLSTKVINRSPAQFVGTTEVTTTVVEDIQEPKTTELRPDEEAKDITEIVTKSPPVINTTTVIATSVSTSESIVYNIVTKPETDDLVL